VQVNANQLLNALGVQNTNFPLSFVSVYEHQG